MGDFSKEREPKFTAIYRSYVDEIYRYIYLRTGFHKAVAEDLTQEVFVAVFREMQRFKGLCSERTWVYRIAGNKLNDYYRKQYAARVEWTEFDDDLADRLDDPSQDVEKMLIAATERDKIRSCFSGLSELHRIVLAMKYIDGKSVKDIALTVGKTPKAVESVLQRAKNAFIRSYVQIEKREAGL